MTKIFNDIKLHLKDLNAVQLLIYVLVTVFVFTVFVSSLQTDKSLENNFMLQNFALSSDIKQFFNKPYSLLSFGFINGYSSINGTLRTNFINLLFNLIILYYVGNLFLDYFNTNKFWTYFVLGSVAGGILYLLGYEFTASFKSGKQGILIGSSAGITALMVGLATLIPNYTMNFRFIGNVKLWIITVIWISLSLILISGSNPGGQLAHIGGGILGFVLTKYFYQTKRKSKSFKVTRSSNLKTVYKKTDKGLTNYQKDRLRQLKIDKLLEKISKSGYETLTKEEKDFLNKVSKE